MIFKYVIVLKLLEIKRIIFSTCIVLLFNKFEIKIVNNYQHSSEVLSKLL
jgi:hypothetical protein